MKKIIDNFDALANVMFIEPVENDEFYFVQILTRRKDGNFNGTTAITRLVNFWEVTSKEEFLSLKDEIISLCREKNARAYVSPNKRSFEKVQEYVNFMTESEHESEFSYSERPSYRGIRYNGCVLGVKPTENKYTLDLDDIKIGDSKYNEIVSFINEHDGDGGPNTDKVILAVPSKTGTHLITRDIDILLFRQTFKLGGNKRNPCLLYYEWEEDENN